jgi:hypothetical protein
MNYKQNFLDSLAEHSKELHKSLTKESAINETPFDGGKYNFGMSCHVDQLTREVEMLELREEITYTQARDIISEIEDNS